MCIDKLYDKIIRNSKEAERQYLSMATKPIVSKAEKLKESPLTDEAFKEQLERVLRDNVLDIDIRITGDTVIGAKINPEDKGLFLRSLSDEAILKECKERGLDVKYSEEENLAYRLNWVMQDYYKAGEDEEEREHRLKCYKLFWDALEDETFFKPIKMQVYEVGKGTTICGQNYKCKKDYKVGNCRYIKDAIYHCGRDGYLTDQNGVSWSCTPEWFNEYIQSNTEWAEEEKTRFVSGQFLQCKLSFNEFKEGEHYWLEYIGDDRYVGRSDNILNQKFHITPRQLYTLFSQQLEDKQKEQKPISFNEPYNPDDYEVVIEGNATGLKRKEQKPTGTTINGEPVPTENQSVDIPLAEWSEEDERMLNRIINDYENGDEYWFKAQCSTPFHSKIAWLKSLRPSWKLSEEQEEPEYYQHFDPDC